MRLKVAKAIIVLLMVAIVGLFVYEFVTDKTEAIDNLPRTIIVFIGAVISFVKLSRQPGRKTLAFYESQYAGNIKDAFAEDSKSRKQLLKGIRHYNENSMKSAVNCFTKLKYKCQTRADKEATFLFLALCFTDIGLVDEAIHVYEELVNSGVANSTIHSNLGHLYSNKGDFDNAVFHFERALMYDRNNAFAYNNLSACYYRMADFDKAVENAEKALEINSKMHQAAALLAMVYAKRGDDARTEKYYHIAISNGANPDKLANAIEEYRKEN